MQKRVTNIFALMALLLFTVSAALGQNLLPAEWAGLEAGVANYWSDANAGGATLTWATDEHRTSNYSLKIEKTATGTASSWVGEDILRNWATSATENVTFEIGGWVKTEGVNISPANDAAKIQLKFSAFDGDVDVFGEPIVVDVDQSVATSTFGLNGWVKTSIVVTGGWPVAVNQVKAEFVFGSDATGTAWLDDVFWNKTDPTASGPGNAFGPSMDTPTGWYYWWPGYSAGLSIWDTTQEFTVTASTAEAHSGTYSGLTKALHVRETENDYFLGTDIFPVPNEPMVITGWMKSDSLVNPDSINSTNGSWDLLIKAVWHDVDSGLDGWGQIHENQIPITVPGDSFGWTPFAVVATPPTDLVAIGMHVRLNVGKLVTGSIYWDDISVAKLSDVQTPVGVIPEPEFLAGVPRKVELLQNYPNPFNPSTVIQYGVPNAANVKVEIFNLLGQHVITLVDRNQVAGTYEVTWNGDTASGNIVAGGMYFYRLRIGDTAMTKKMLFLK